MQPHVTTRRKSKTTEQRFWAKVDRRGPDDCWEWIASFDGRGYGQFWDGEKKVQAHRYSYDLHSDTPLGALHGCHSCDNPKCVNPNHIFAGTCTDNIHDMIAKGRRYQPYVAGESNGRAKLTLELVREARQRRVAGESVTSLAREYGICHSAMSSAIRGETWPDA